MSNDHDQTSGAANKPYTVSAKKPAAVAISNALRRFHLPLFVGSFGLSFIPHPSNWLALITLAGTLLALTGMVLAWRAEAKAERNL